MPSRVTFGEPFTAQCKVRETKRYKETAADALFSTFTFFSPSPLIPFVARAPPLFQLINLSTQPVVWQLGFDEARVSFCTL